MDKYKEINEILMKWNPLSVTGPALSDEYIGLIPSILAQKNESDLKIFMETTLFSYYGIEYEDQDTEGREGFNSVISQLANIIF